MPEAAWPETGLVHAYPGTTTPSRFRPHLVYVSTRHQWFTFVHLSVTYLIRSIAGPFPSVLTTVAFDHRRRRRFGTRSCQPVPRGLFFPHRLCSCATDEAHLFVRCSWRTVSRAGEFHPHALPELDVNLSAHPAPIHERDP